MKKLGLAIVFFMVSLTVGLQFSHIRVGALDVYSETFVVPNSQEIKGSENDKKFEDVTLDSMINSSIEGAKISDLTITLENCISNNQVINVVSGDLTLDNVKIRLINSEVKGAIFRVTSGELILKNVVIEKDATSKISNGIVCNGVVIIDNLTMPKVLGDSVNLTTATAKAVLKNVNAESIPEINMAVGQVVVEATTDIEGVINLNVGDLETLKEDEATHVGRTLVRGKNTLARFYQNNFRLVGAPYIGDGVVESGLDLLNVLSENTSFYMDYVGIVGDNIADENSGFRVDDTDIFLKTGDLILTRFNVNYVNNGTGEKIKIVGKYATPDLWLRYNDSEAVSAYAIGQMLIDCENTGVMTPTDLNNYTSICGKQVIVPTDLSDNPLITSKVTAQIKVYDKSNNLINALTTQVVCPLEKSTTVVIKFGDNQVDRVVCDNHMTMEKIFENEKFGYYKLTNIEGRTEPTVEDRELSISSSEIEYKGEDLAVSATNNCMPYYMSGEDRVCLTPSECVITKDGTTTVTTIKDVGVYTIEVNPSDDYNYINTTFTVRVTAKTITANFYDTTHKYDGEAHSLRAELTGVYAGDQVDIVYSANNSQTLPNGDGVSVTISINNPNYVLASNSTSAILKITKGTIVIDSNTSVFADLTFTYDGEARTALVTRLPDGAEVLEYSNNVQSQVCLEDQGYYVAVARLKIAKPDLYDTMTKSQLTCKITVLRKELDSGITLEPSVQTYTGKTLQVSVTGTLAPEVKSNLNYVYKQNGVVATPRDVGVYDTSVTLELHRDYLRNYKLKQYTYTSTLTIEKATLNLSKVISFENVTVDYDGNEHNCTYTIASGYEGVLAVSSEDNPRYANAGTYEQSITLELLDEQNYNPLTTNTLTATLKINKIDFDLTGLTYTQASYVYAPNTPRKIEASGVENLDITYDYFLITPSGEEPLDTEYAVTSGQYAVYINFEIEDIESRNYNDIPTVRKVLTINQVEVDVKNAKLTSKNIMWDGNAHSLEVEGFQSDYVIPKYSKENLSEIGEYLIEVAWQYDSNYRLINEKPLSAVLIISKAKYDMSSVKFDDISATYDGTTKEAKLTGTLPAGVTVKKTENNTRTNAGTQQASVEFQMADTVHYERVESMTCTITINPIEITVDLEQTQFVYNGNLIEVKAIPTGVLQGETLTVTLDNGANISAGNYTATIKSLSSPNYTVIGKKSFAYTIAKAVVPLTNIKFDDLRVTYDGKEHCPTVQGVEELPKGVFVKIINETMINVGEYTVYAEFMVNNGNYEVPSRMSAKVTIEPIAILIDFDDRVTFVEDGNVVNIDFEPKGVLKGDSDIFTVTYTPVSQPRLAGNYVCTVTLDQNKGKNYVIIGNNKHEFEILVDTKEFESENLEMTVVGEGFKADTELEVKTLNSQDLTSKIDNLSIKVKKFQAFQICLDNDKYEDLQVSLKMTSLNLKNSRYLKVYKVQGDKLIELDYEIEGEKLLFVARAFDEIIILEENTIVESNKWISTIIILLSGVALILVAWMTFRYSIKKKNFQNTFVDIEK